MLDLHRGILEEFAEAGRLSTDLAFSVMSGFLTIKSELHKKYCSEYRARKRLRTVRKRRPKMSPEMRKARNAARMRLVRGAS